MDQYSEGDEFNESKFDRRLVKKLFLISLATSIAISTCITIYKFYKNV